MKDGHDVSTSFQALTFAEDIAADRELLEQLKTLPGIDFIDPNNGQRTSGYRWAYYPWRKSVIKIPGPDSFNTERLDRNRNLITVSEQQELRRLKIGVVGLSSGHAVAYLIAEQGLCGSLRLADFDELELSNLNRVPAGVFDLGVNKAIVAARRIAELDPYLNVEVFTSGVAPESLEHFLDGVDVVIDQSDSLDIKILLRQAAREHRIPVIMATSDGARIDVERYDLEPMPPIMHGLLGDVDPAKLSGLSTKEKLPYLLRLMDARRFTRRGAASLIEVGKTLRGWPQVASDIWIGAATVAEAVRRLGLGEPLESGRTQIDVTAALDRLSPPDPPAEEPRAAGAVDAPGAEIAPKSVAQLVAEAAVRAPSGGNCQPWRIVVGERSIEISLAAVDSSTMDVDFRASAVALGAAMFNMRVAAAVHGVLGPVSFDEDLAETVLRGSMTWGDGDDPALAELQQPMLARHSNRHRGIPTVMDPAAVQLLQAVTAGEGASLRLVTDRSAIATIAEILACSDRIRYLTPQLHADMISELRWPADPAPETGIDVLSLELDAGGLAALDLMRRPEVMAELARWDGGSALGDMTREQILASSAVAVVVVDGATLTDYARGGAALEGLWIVAQQCGFGVQPVSPVFLYAHNDIEMRILSPAHADQLNGLRRQFRALLSLAPGEYEVLVLRLFTGPAPSVQSRRRSLAATMDGARR